MFDNNDELAFKCKTRNSEYEELIIDSDVIAYETIEKIKTTLENIRAYLKSRSLLLTQQWITFEDWLNEFSVRDPNN